MWPWVTSSFSIFTPCSAATGPACNSALGLYALQFLHPHFGVGLAAFAHLAQQLEQRQQARLGADEAAFAQGTQPGQGLLRGRREVEVRLVGPRRVELAQPGLVVRSPVVQVVERRLRIAGRPALFAYGVERVIQCRSQLGLVDDTAALALIAATVLRARQRPQDI